MVTDVHVLAVLSILAFSVAGILVGRLLVVRARHHATDSPQAKAAREALLSALQIVQVQYAALAREHQSLKVELEVWRDRAIRHGYGDGP